MQGMRKGCCSLSLSNKTAAALTPLPKPEKSPTLHPHAASKGHDALQRRLPSPPAAIYFKHQDFTRLPNAQQWYNKNVLKPRGCFMRQLHGDFFGGLLPPALLGCGTAGLSCCWASSRDEIKYLRRGRSGKDAVSTCKNLGEVRVVLKSAEE